MLDDPDPLEADADLLEELAALEGRAVQLAPAVEFTRRHARAWRDYLATRSPADDYAGYLARRGIRWDDAPGFT